MFEDGSIFNQLLVERLNYFIYVVLLLIGLWAMICKKQPDQKVDWDVLSDRDYFILCLDQGERETTIPIYLPEHDPHGAHLSMELNTTDSLASGPQVLDTSFVPGYTCPLPHVLMLTAIVVGVAMAWHFQPSDFELTVRQRRTNFLKSLSVKMPAVRRGGTGGGQEDGAATNQPKVVNLNARRPLRNPKRATRRQDLFRQMQKKQPLGIQQRDHRKTIIQESPKPKRARRTRQSSPRNPGRTGLDE